MRDCKAMCLLHQCVDIHHFEKIAGAATSKEAWDILEKGNISANQLKKVRLQTMRRQYELMQMEDTKKICKFLQSNYQANEFDEIVWRNDHRIHGC